MKGYIIIARQSLESDIWKKPPYYWKVWCYLLMRANWKKFGNINRGQLITNYNEIRDGISWYIGSVKKTISKDQLFNVLEYLRNPMESNTESNTESNSETDTKATMITTSKTTRGILITIVKYGFYQDSSFYESNDKNSAESNTESNGQNDMKATGKQQEADTKNEEIEELRIKNNNIYISSGINFKDLVDEHMVYEDEFDN